MHGNHSLESLGAGLEATARCFRNLYSLWIAHLQCLSPHDNGFLENLRLFLQATIQTVMDSDYFEVRSTRQADFAPLSLNRRSGQMILVMKISSRCCDILIFESMFTCEHTSPPRPGSF